MSVTPYQFAINNVKAHIRGEENQQQVAHSSTLAMSVFDAAQVLSVAFMKDRAEVIADLLA